MLNVQPSFSGAIVLRNVTSAKEEKIRTRLQQEGVTTDIVSHAGGRSGDVVLLSYDEAKIYKTLEALELQLIRELPENRRFVWSSLFQKYYKALIERAPVIDVAPADASAVGEDDFQSIQAELSKQFSILG